MDRYEQFKVAFIGALLWSTSGGNYDFLDQHFGPEDFSDELSERIDAECKAFFEGNKGYIDDVYFIGRRSGDTSVEAMAGHDFALTRNGHGAGFWDGSWTYEVGILMTAASDLAGPLEVYVGDDGKLYA